MAYGLVECFIGVRQSLRQTSLIGWLGRSESLCELSLVIPNQSKYFQNGIQKVFPYVTAENSRPPPASWEVISQVQNMALCQAVVFAVCYI